MRKTITIGLFLLCIMATASVAGSRGIGLRGGGGSAFGGEVSYHHGMGESNRLELDLGWNGSDSHNAIGLTGIYQWTFGIKKGFGWFVGPGAGIGFWSVDGNDDDSGINLAIGGQIGIEYDFNEHGAPIQIGLDGRPMMGFLSGSGFGWGTAFSIRYTF